MSALGKVHWSSPHLVTSGDDPGHHAGPNFQEDLEACEVDFAHDPKAYPAEQVTRDGPVEGKRRGLRLACSMYTCVEFDRLGCTGIILLSDS